MICVTLSKMVDGLDKREATFRFTEEIHSCPDFWDISSPAYKDKKQANKNGTAVTVCLKGGISADIWFRPNLSIFPALSVFSPAINVK